jgi:N utilization substance protein B
MNRQQSRELALQLLFQREFTKELKLTEEEETHHLKRGVDSRVWNYTLEIIRGIETHLETIDGKINNHSTHWNISRMATVDVNILRIGLFEILYAQAQVPPKVAINEAVELAKRYSTTESSSFINGVLDHAYKSEGL